MRIGGSVKRLITISKDPYIKVKSQISEFLSPSFVYLPIDETAQLKIQKKKIMKNDALYKWNNKIYYSPISGTIKSINKRYDAFLQPKLYMEIANDFQENDHYQGVKSTTMVISTDLHKKVKEYQGADFSSFKGKKRIIFNGMEDEPYLANKPFIHRYHLDDLLIMLDTLASVYKIPKIDIYLKETDRESIEIFDSRLGQYPNMELFILPDLYPLANDIVLTKFLKLTEEDKIVSTDEIFTYYYEIIKERKKDFCFITVTGDAITFPQVIKVKIGTLFKEVNQSLIEFNTANYTAFLNGIMKGKKINWENLIIDDSVRAIYFMKNKEEKVSDCIHCGKCNSVCPFGCNPYYHVISGGLHKSEKCIECGLCSFVCPSNIEIKNAKGEIK